MTNSTTKEPSDSLDYNCVKEELLKIMDNPNHDDGSIGPILIRLAWHSSGTYDKESKSGGSCGAGMRLPESSEALDPENKGLEVARAFLDPVKVKYPSISYSDLWVLAAYTAIEHSGGPKIEFQAGRQDIEDPDLAVPAGRLPQAEFGCNGDVDEKGRLVGWENLAKHMRSVFNRMELSDGEIVALLCGGHVYGRCHSNYSGYEGVWVEEPTKFSNEYAADMVEDEWICVTNDTLIDGKPVDERVRPAKGKRQYVSKNVGSHADDMEGTPQMMLASDMVLLWDDNFKVHLKRYAEDTERLKKDFGLAYKKLTENGASSSLSCPYGKNKR
jgi:peroxiredoxin